MSTPAASSLAWALCGGHSSDGSSWITRVASAFPTEITMPILLPQSGHVIHVILSFLAAITSSFTVFYSMVKSGVVNLLHPRLPSGVFSDIFGYHRGDIYYFD